MGAKYIYYFVDEALRVCNTNNSNRHRTKWFGYVQKNQFNLSEGMSFAEWQEHPNNLSPPKLAGLYSYAFGGANHTIGTAGNYYANNRGVAVLKKSPLSDDSIANTRLTGAHSSTVTAFNFEDTEDKVTNDLGTVGEVISIGTALGTAPSEFLFCKKNLMELVVQLPIKEITVLKIVQLPIVITIQL